MKIVAHLEQQGISCWIAPRNIPLGANYQASIIQGIRKSTLLIFVFTISSNESDAIVYEIEKANAQKIPIIPFKIDNIPYSDSLEYFLRSKQATMAYNSSIDMAISELASHIKNYQLQATDTNVKVSQQEETVAQREIPEEKKPDQITKEINIASDEISNDELNDKLNEIFEIEDIEDRDIAFEKIKKKFSNHYMIMIYEFFILVNKKEYKKARNAIENLLLAYPDFAEARMHYALFFKNVSGEYDAAKKEFEKAIALDGTKAEFYYEYSKLFADNLEDNAMAVKYYTKAIELNSELKDPIFEKKIYNSTQQSSVNTRATSESEGEDNSKIIAQFNSITCRKLRDKSNYMAVFGEMADADVFIRRNSIEIKNSAATLKISGITKIAFLDSSVDTKCSFNYIQIDFNFYEKKPTLWSDDLSILIFKVSFWGGKPTSQIYNRLVELMDNGAFQLNTY